MVVRRILLATFFVAVASNSTGKSYFFKSNANNEFTVYNRIYYLNHNISDTRVNPHPPQNYRTARVNGSTANNRPFAPKIQSPGKFYLDEEWNYDHTAVNKSNLPVFIKQFYEQRVKDPNETHTVRILFNVNRNTSSKVIKFDLNSLKPEEKVVEADMYFYWPLENSSSTYKTSVVLRLFQLEAALSNESNLIDNPDVHKLFNVIYISKAQKGWQAFKIKKPIDNWSNGDQNLGLILTISSFEENKLIDVFRDANEGLFRTFAVLHVQNNGTRPSSNQPTYGSTNDTSTSSKTNAVCTKRPWQLDFNHFGWNNLILYPEGPVKTHQCSGKCFAGEEHMTNHAKLRQFTNGKQGFKEKVCCVPTEFRSLPLMFLDKSGNVVLKHYEDMIVHTCGCR